MLQFVVLILIIVRSTLGIDQDGQSIVVTIKQGLVRGYKAPEGDFYVFYGVPYATAPTGTQRFHAPLPPPVWEDIYEADNKNIVCPQLASGLIANKQQKENCLVANVYVPQTDNTNLPVLVYVHGGGYSVGFGDFATPKHLVRSKKVIIVNFNYRLGVHGFLCLGTKDVPGNAGMKDQVALLRWVKSNIDSFGGNPNDVTIAGYSAGSSSVDLLMLSRMANGLFKKVIPESGANTASFTIQIDPIGCTKVHAKRLNFSNVDDTYALEEFYKSASYDLITSINMFEKPECAFAFVPCIERDVGVEMFLDDSPINILRSGNYEKRPMLYGFTKMEGMIRVNSFEFWKKIMNAKFSESLPADLQFKNEDQKEDMAVKIKNFYFGTGTISEENIMGYINYFTDTMFSYSTILSVKLQVEAGNNQIYLYEYAFKDENSPMIPYINEHGVDHCAQSWAVLDRLNVTHTNESLASDGLLNMKKMLREMWLNFVTTGKPVPDGSPFPVWRTTGPNASPYMVLDQVPELKETLMLEQRMQFWDKIYSKYYRQPVPPPVPQAKPEV